MNRALGTWGTIYTLVIIVLEGGKRGQEIIDEELWLKNFQIIVKDINLQFKKLRESQKDKLGGGGGRRHYQAHHSQVTNRK